MPYNNRVLIIDDDPNILSIFESILSPKKSSAKESTLSLLNDLLSDDITDVDEPEKRIFDVDTASQGEQGYKMVKQAIAEGRPYSVLFSDMRMPPGWDGIKTVREVRNIDPTIEIIIVTAYSDAPVSDIVKQVGFTDRLLYLKKPFDDEEVLQLADSLSMRWNLEIKVKGMVKILEGMIDSFFKLKTAFYMTEEI
ncbi:response regulator [sulfur-oxidizing endosymbiont of Gigantopelta aegis]|uniref:response regulator n=1 Tax=sulfur-oxidizing endosymbiont of Gigantopelta aegis TaxID=2794934 RepID=UPI0018DC4652|nr:response regulator [sulfur-oxidizing endosymbiont of Gigantopelta aegis]